MDNSVNDLTNQADTKPATPRTGGKFPTPTLWQRISYHAIGLFPLAWLLFDYWFGLLGPDPIRTMILRTGKAAIIILVLSLAVTPLIILTGWKQAIVYRKPLGLYGFMYVCFHLLIFVWLDYGFQLSMIAQELVTRRYIIFGFIAFLLLIPLALTSNAWSHRKLGKNWKTLHKLVYLIAVLAVTHYVLLSKNNYTQPIIFGSIIAVLLLMRLGPIKQALTNLRGRAG